MQTGCLRRAADAARLPVPLMPPTRCQSPGPPHFPSPHGKPQFPGMSPVCDTNQAPTPEQSRGPTVRLTRFQPSLGPDSWGPLEPQFPYLLNGRPSSPDPSGLPGGLCNEGRCEVRGQDHRPQAMWPAVYANALYMRQVPSLHVQPARCTRTHAHRHRPGTPSGPHRLGDTQTSASSLCTRCTAPSGRDRPGQRPRATHPQQGGTLQNTPRRPRAPSRPAPNLAGGVLTWGCCAEGWEGPGSPCCRGAA